jgi:hypothetical protein
VALFKRLKGQPQRTEQERESDAVLRRAPALAPEPPTPPVTPEPHKSILRARCARFDKPFENHYELQADGSFRFVESVKVGEDVGSPSGGSASRIRAPRIETIPIERLDRHECPWCGSDTINGPCLCGSLICGGETEKSNGRVWVRHLGSCGRKWPGIPMTEIQTEETAKPASRPQAPASREPALPVSTSRALVISK